MEKWNFSRRREIWKNEMALLYGADAVYMAGKAFGLRAYGGNFTREEMKEAVEYAHSMGKKCISRSISFPGMKIWKGLTHT